MIFYNSSLIIIYTLLILLSYTSCISSWLAISLIFSVSRLSLPFSSGFLTSFSVLSYKSLIKFSVMSSLLIIDSVKSIFVFNSIKALFINNFSSPLSCFYFIGTMYTILFFFLLFLKENVKVLSQTLFSSCTETLSYMLLSGVFVCVFFFLLIIFLKK